MKSYFENINHISAVLSLKFRCSNFCRTISHVGVTNGWVWGGHNWVEYIIPIYPLKLI